MSIVARLRAAILAFGLLALSCAASSAWAQQQLVWQGIISSNGQQVPAFTLRPDTTYIIAVSGDMYFGRWQQNGRSLLNDACFEFNAKDRPDPLPVFKNSAGVPVCDGVYRRDHIYRSAPFLGNGQQLSLWIFDTDYRDNSGGLAVQVYTVPSPSVQQPPTPPPHPPQPQPPPAQRADQIVGSWRGCDGRIVTFAYENGVYVGRYTSLAGLSRFGFQLGEIGYRVRPQSDGSYVGEVKWRWTDGRSQWRPTTVRIKGDTYTDTGSDSCSRQMQRVRGPRYY